MQQLLRAMVIVGRVMIYGAKLLTGVRVDLSGLLSCRGGCGHRGRHGCATTARNGLRRIRGRTRVAGETVMPTGETVMPTEEGHTATQLEPGCSRDSRREPLSRSRMALLGSR